ncbi:MAG TPA: hemolysin III family protein [Gaiellaceae bacterium]|nr:hemolysin III family protein [Gaiellaceae bacterium]
MSDIAQLGEAKPRLRGVLHEWAFYLAIPLGVVVGLFADTSTAKVAAAVFAGGVVCMFGASALYHRVAWSPPWGRWLRRVDHAGIYAMIAGSYTPFGLLVLSGDWRITVLAIVWGGAGAAILTRMLWARPPRWLPVLIGCALGWVGVVVFPQLLTQTGILASMLVLASGVCYTVGGIVYARRRPDPFPAVFGYHEVFHTLVVAAVAVQYCVVAFFVLPT